MSPRTRSAQRERAMIEAALEVFLEKGFEGATMLEIATRAKVGKGTLYGLAKSKEDLCLLVLLDYFQNMVGEVLNIDLSQGNPMDMLFGLMREAGAMFDNQSAILSLSIELLAHATIRRGLNSHFRSAFQNLYQQFYTPVEALLQAAIDNGQIRKCDTNAVARLVAAMLDGLGFQQIFDRDNFDATRVIDEFIDHLNQSLVLRADKGEKRK